MKSNCKEIKEYLNGDTREFLCQLLKFEEKKGILKYKIKKNHDVNGTILNPGDITYGFYWANRPFNLYKWQNPAGQLKGNYFNIADKVKLSRKIFHWRDLILDILVKPEQNETIIIDEDELPKDLDRRLKEYIFSSKKYILQNYQDILQKTDDIIHGLKTN